MKKITISPMFRIILLLSSLTFFALTSCNINRESQRKLDLEEKKEEQTVIQREQNGSSLFDSSQRHWSFWTDGWLYYHPDSGLRAQGGHFYMNESTKRAHIAEQERTEAIYQKSENQKINVKEQSHFKSNFYKVFWIITCLSIIGIIVYFVYKYVF